VLVDVWDVPVLTAEVLHDQIGRHHEHLLSIPTEIGQLLRRARVGRKRIKRQQHVDQIRRDVVGTRARRAGSPLAIASEPHTAAGTAKRCWQPV